MFGIFASLKLSLVSFDQLQQLAEPVGIGAPQVRTILGRMNRDGLVQVIREGKRAYYSLSNRALNVRNNVGKGLRSPNWTNWTGMYLGALFTIAASSTISIKDQEARRYRIRKKLTGYRFASWYPGYWIKPCLEDEEIPEHLKKLETEGDCRLIRFKPELPLDTAEINELWNLTDLSKEMSDVLKLEDLAKTDWSRSAGKEAFAAGLKVGKVVMDLLAKDPLLPPELLPEDWPGDVFRKQVKVFFRETGKRQKEFTDKIIIQKNIDNKGYKD